jgi:hypothetical protein
MDSNKTMENSEVPFALTSLPAVVVVVVTTGCVTVALLGAYFVVQAEVQKRSVSVMSCHGISCHVMFEFGGCCFGFVVECVER